MSESRALAAIDHELGTLGTSDVIADLLPELRRLLDTEIVLVLTPAESIEGLEIARFQSLGFDDVDGTRAGFADVFRRQPRRYAWYDPICPEPDQRNRVIEAHSVMGPGELERSYIYERVLRPFGLHEHRQPRVLLCERGSLLAWFGAFHPGPVTPRQLRMLGRLARPMRRRLSLERRLAPRVRSAALVAALDQLGAPAFVLDGSHIAFASASGRALLASRRRELHEALSSPAAAAASGIELVPLRLAGCPDLRLAIARGTTRDARIAAAVARVSVRWGLTARQRHILGLVIRGDASVTIAADLGIGQRAVELHISAMFERAGVASRAELVAAALTA